MFCRKKTAVPEWASVMEEREYSLFMSAVDDYFKRRGEPDAAEDGIIRLEKDNGNSGRPLWSIYAPGPGRKNILRIEHG
jgi:hypothetical protein